MSGDSRSAHRRTNAGQRRGGYGVTLVVGLLAAGGVTLGVSRPWFAATATTPGLPTIEASATGADLAPLAGALGVVLLASFGAVIATRGWVRRGLGLLIVLASLVVLVSAVHPTGAGDVLRDGLSAKGWAGGDFDTSRQGWMYLVLISSAVCAVAGLAVFRYGAGWATMGREYDAPTAAPVTDEPAPDGDLTGGDMWKAIDRGHDPTQRP